MLEKKVKELIKLMEEHDLYEVEITYFPFTKIRIKGLERNVQKEQPEKAKKELPTYIIKSSMVGTFYKKVRKKRKTNVKVGDVIKDNDVVGYIKALNIPHEITARIENKINSEPRLDIGKVTKVLVNNGDPVEYGKELFELEPIE